MNNNRKSHRTAMAIFAVILAAVVIVAFITTIENDTKLAGNVAQPGTTGLAHPHPPLDRAPGEPIRK